MRMLEMLRRGLYATPVLGRISREVVEGSPDNKWYLAMMLVTLWILAGMTWGLPALVVPFLLVAPLCLVMLVALSRG